MNVPAHPPLSVRYEATALPELLAQPDVLAVFGFGAHAPDHDDPRYVHVGLEPVAGAAPFEVWRGCGPVRHGHDGDIAWAHGDQLGFGVIEVDEAQAGGIAAAAELAYAALLQHVARGPFPALLRVWNYLDAITEGEGDAERYRQFSIGRARGMLGHVSDFPAATAIGRRDGRRVLQVYWLAAARPGRGIENPRQISAYRYPRQYGPQPPSFARATLPPLDAMPLLLSGTASVVGHASAHPDDIHAQLSETFRNLDALVEVARPLRPGLGVCIGASSLLKAYVRQPDHAAAVATALDSRLPDPDSALLLHADVCRTDLLVEIDGFHR